MKINELRTCWPKIISIRPQINLDQSWRSELPGWEEISDKDALFTDWNNNLPTLEIRSPPFRLDINELKISPSNFRSIGPHEAGSAVWWNLDSKEKKKKSAFFFSLTSKIQWLFFFVLYNFLFLFLLTLLLGLQRWRRRRENGFFFPFIH